ncbi:hypothetical protein KX928_17540 [Roseobacter sp. YSTF-M11]|uniref:DUF6456 domain-containing protein n=1 Tax=Roseobacter insulae TaxID=2859783 RepID=A0A9X1FXR6_9RHOB|nr:DUF6456 domain-containing protein [Roseobacter insulae]MBW4709593.1 hypothetical protein [Roseobacter insulae]
MPAITPDQAAAYLRHTVGAEPIREIARAESVHASTVLRRIRSIEDARDCPIWSQIWDDISREYAAPKTDAPRGFDLESLLYYLGTSAYEVSAALATASIGRKSTVSILVGIETARSPVLQNGDQVATISRPAALGLVLSGVARCKPGQGTVRVARLELTGVAPDALGEIKTPPPVRPAVHRIASEGRKRYGPALGSALIAQMERASRMSAARFEAEHIALVWSMIETAQTDPARFLDAIADLNIGETLTAIFKALIVDGLGFEAIEKALGWPARSCKMIFLIALDLARDRGYAA